MGYLFTLCNYTLSTFVNVTGGFLPALIFQIAVASCQNCLIPFLSS